MICCTTIIEKERDFLFLFDLLCVFKLFILDDPFKKIDADGLFVVPCEDAFAETLDHAGLADGAVAHNHHLLLHLKERKNTFKKKKTNENTFTGGCRS